MSNDKLFKKNSRRKSKGLLSKDKPLSFKRASKYFDENQI